MPFFFPLLAGEGGHHRGNKGVYQFFSLPKPHMSENTKRKEDNKFYLKETNKAFGWQYIRNKIP